MIEIHKNLDLKESDKHAINKMIDTEFGHIPIVQETTWALPDWTILYRESGIIKSICNIVERSILVDDHSIKIAGINNVITPKEYRGKSLASKLMKEAEKYIFGELHCSHGLLLCADALIPFYSRLNWYTIHCPVYFEQTSVKKLWMAKTMFLSPFEKVNAKLIDLKGLPW